MSKKKVGLLYGGRSVEHGVSVNSAKNIYDYLDRELFEPVPIGITTDGRWYLTPSVTRDMAQGKGLGLILDAVKPGFILLASDDRIKPDVIFPVLHGTDGEDGSIQGLLNAMSLPMVGTGVLGSAVSINKITAKQLLAAAKLPVLPYLAYTFDERPAIRFEEVRDKIGMPCIVKSASLGSSVGVNKAKDKTSFNKAVDEAFRYDNAILIEQFIEARELECAILGNNPPEASVAGEIVVDKKKYEFYSFDAKYVDETAVSINLPAKVTPAIMKKIQELSVRAFQALKCQDFARVDLFLTEKGQVYVNEINTIPGFTNSSMYPMMWNAMGVPFPKLITRLIELALERHSAQNRIQREFASSLNF